MSGTTYYIPVSFYISSGPATFQPGSVVKYGSDAFLSIHGQISCPPVGQLMPVLTSKDEDLFGTVIPGSTGNPVQMASKAIWVYYTEDASTEVRNMRIRWAKRGIEYNTHPGYGVTHYVRDSLFQHSQIGIYVDMPSGYVMLENVRRCYVSTPTNVVSGTVSGTVTEDCGPFYATASFSGLFQSETGTSIPDTTGVAGPNHFMVLLNGTGGGVAVYDKYTGVRLVNAALRDFFALTIADGQYAGTYPVSAFDPRLVYDPVHQRWIASAISSPSKRVMLAVSKGSDPVGSGGSDWISEQWTKYLVPVDTCWTDFDTLGVDANGIYICVHRLPSCPAGTQIAALPKAPFIDGTANVVQDQFIFGVSAGSIVQPALNVDAVTPTDAAWFVSGASCRKLSWVNGFSNPPQWQGWWVGFGTSVPFGDLSIPGLNAPQLGSPATVALFWAGSGMTCALVRKVAGVEYLWTCRAIGVNQSGTRSTEFPADRSAIEWFQVQTSTGTRVATGRIHDTNASNFKFYYMPSLAANRNGDILFGFSGSSSADYIGAYYTGRLANGVMPASPIRYLAGKNYFDAPTNNPSVRWGDYSLTSVDPDGLTLWTIQEYAEVHFFPPGIPNAFGTRIVAVTPF